MTKEELFITKEEGREAAKTILETKRSPDDLIAFEDFAEAIKQVRSKKGTTEILGTLDENGRISSREAE